jgi:hypothetical protein
MVDFMKMPKLNKISFAELTLGYGITHLLIAGFVYWNKGSITHRVFAFIEQWDLRRLELLFDAVFPFYALFGIILVAVGFRKMTSKVYREDGNKT